MRRIACNSWVVVASLVLALAGCKSGDDDDSEVGAPPTNHGPQAGGGDDPKGGASAAGSSGGGAQAGRGGSSSGEGGTGQAGNGGSSSAGSGGSSGGSGSASTDAGSGGNEPTPFPDTPLSKLPQSFAGAICDALRDCLGESKLRELTRREACESAVEAELRAKDFAHMDGSVSAGRVLYNPKQLEACLDGIVGLGCDVLNHSFPKPCPDVIDGNVESGGECVIGADCKGNAYCAGSATCPSKCAALLGVGATCDGDGQCGDGLDCIGGKCTAPGLAGDDCGGGSGKYCALGLNCKGATDTVVGSCVDNAAIQVGAENGECEPGGNLCKDGLSCVYDGSGGFRCEAAVASGGACHLGLPGQCPPEEYCNSTEVTVASTCKKLPGDGQACVLNGLCKGGLVCVAGSGSGTCHAIAANGEDCVSNATCRSGNCSDGKCEPPPACL